MTTVPLDLEDDPLPAIDSDCVQKLQLREVVNRSIAYDMILQAREHATDCDDVMTAEIAGRFLLEFHARSGVFGDTPCESLVRRVMSSSQSAGDNKYDVIYRLGQLCRDRLIRLFHRHFIEPPLRPYLAAPPLGRPFDTVEDMIDCHMKATGSDYATLRRKVLARDGFRCILSDCLDRDFSFVCPELSAMAKCTCKDKPTIRTSHIMRASTTQLIDSMGIREDDSVFMVEHNDEAVPILESFGFSKIAKALGQPGGIHQPWNMLSLQFGFSDPFDWLNIWLEETQQPNCYKICSTPRTWDNRDLPHRPHVSGDLTVEFNPHYEEAPPPDPQLLALHATCARVTYMTGASRVLIYLEGQELVDFDPS